MSIRPVVSAILGLLDEPDKLPLPRMPAIEGMGGGGGIRDLRMVDFVPRGLARLRGGVVLRRLLDFRPDVMVGLLVALLRSI